MICALIDFACYRLELGKYNSNSSALKGWISKDGHEMLIGTLQVGDALFVHTRRSLLAWLVMYITRSPISHMAIYVGSGKILHATTAGVTYDEIHVLLRNGSMVTPLILPIASPQRPPIGGAAEQYLERPYGWSMVICKGLLRLFARDLRAFRREFLADGVIAIFLVSFVISQAFDLRLWPWLLAVYFSVLLFNACLSIARPLPFQWTADANDLFAVLRSMGARRVLDAGPMPSVPKGCITTDMYVLLPKNGLPSLEQLGAAIEDRKNISFESMDGDKRCVQVRFNSEILEIPFQVVPARQIIEQFDLTINGATTSAICFSVSPDPLLLGATLLVAEAFTRSGAGWYYNPGLGYPVAAIAVATVITPLIDNLEKLIKRQNALAERRCRESL